MAGLTNRSRFPILNYMVQYQVLDRSFAALADGTRRGILEQLGGGDASLSELASNFEMTLTGVKKHVAVLEGAGLVTTEKRGRVRYCRLGPRLLDEETTWIERYRRQAEERYRRLDDLLRTMPDDLEATPRTPANPPTPPTPAADPGAAR